MHYIYLISNELDDAQYVGRTKDPKCRWRKHKSNSRHLKGNNAQAIHLAMNVAGIENFTFTIVEVCESAEKANVSEREWIGAYKAIGAKLYNLTDGGTGNTGWVPSSEARTRIGDAKRGKKQSPETRAKMIASGQILRENRDAIILARQEGKTYKYIADLYKVSTFAIRSVMKSFTNNLTIT